jgi:hypothetical protein
MNVAVSPHSFATGDADRSQPNRGLRFGLVVATSGRRDLLSAVLPTLQACMRRDDLLVIVGASEADWPTGLSGDAILCLVSEKGSGLQRNAALDHLSARGVDAVAFFDDDFLPSPDWINAASRIMTQEPDILALTGHVVADGINGPGFDLADGLGRLQADAQQPAAPPRIEENVPSYGCNMAFRMDAIGDKRFDPRLKLYAWQEDTDFSFRVAAGGRRVRFTGCRGVHLGAKSGRTSGRKLGYSQLINPLYLMRKGTMRPGHALPLMARNILANLARSVRPEPFVDRRGRLAGNCLALLDICRGRIEPDRVAAV